jgi:hypothetical protein
MSATIIRPVGGMSLERALEIAMGAVPASDGLREQWDEDPEVCVRVGVAEGLTDGAIGSKHHVAQPTVTRLRNELGLASRSGYLKPGSPESKALDDAVAKRVREGALDTTIAAELGVTRSQVKHRRNKQKLPANGPDGQPMLNPLARNADKQHKSARVRELHALGWRDREIGNDLGLSERQIAYYRKALGLAAIPR